MSWILVLVPQVPPRCFHVVCVCSFISVIFLREEVLNHKVQLAEFCSSVGHPFYVMSTNLILGHKDLLSSIAVVFSHFSYQVRDLKLRYFSFPLYNITFHRSRCWKTKQNRVLFYTQFHWPLHQKSKDCVSGFPSRLCSDPLTSVSHLVNTTLLVTMFNSLSSNGGPPPGILLL